MKFALIGYGKMGKAIEQVALSRRHEIVLKIDENNTEAFTEENLKKADVAIEFTNPHSAYNNISKMMQWQVPVVSGSTGWLQHMPQVQQLCEQHKGAFIYASNFSIGVNLFFELNKKLAEIMEVHTQYDVTMEEIHHTAKKDAPSGTAITLAETIIDINPVKTSWVNEDAWHNHQLSITSKRVDPAPGTHIIKYACPDDEIEIIHTAKNRNGFATGAVIAAEFIAGKNGIFTMKEVLGIG